MFLHLQNWVDWLLAMSMLNYLTVCVRFVFYVVVRVEFFQFFQSKENINKVV